MDDGAQSLTRSDFASVYERHWQDVYRFALWLTHSRDEAEEITAETFSRAWAGRDRIVLVSVRSYLIAVARNIYREQRRRPGDVVEAGPELPDRQPDPEQVALHRSSLRAALAGMKELPPEDKSALYLRSAAGLSYKEIASVLGISLSSAKVKVHRTRMKLLRASEGAT